MAKHHVVAGLIAVLGCAALPGLSPATAQTTAILANGVTSPEAAMTAALQVDDTGLLPRTPRLAALQRTYEARRAGRDLGDNDLDFEYVTGTQEPSEATGITHRAVRRGNTMTLTTRFRVFDGQPRTQTSRWLRGKDGLWRMDDISDGKRSLADWYRLPVE